MTFLSHISYPALTYILASKYLSFDYNGFDLSILISASILPDIDYLYHRFVKKGRFDENFRHHNWISHFPLFYLPMIVLLAFFAKDIYLLIFLGLLSHFFLDTFFGGDGVKWLYPFSKKSFSLFSQKTKGLHGRAWIHAYKSLPIFWLDIIAFVFLLIYIIGRSF